jgi:DNA modification methylase/DNA-binding XRE family transcriptional regulator/ribosomal protein S27E
MNTEQNSISNQLKEIRYQAKLSQSELARLIGTSRVAVDQWERNSTVPSGMQVKKITELFNKTKNDVKIQIPTTVLQNGSFASRGSTRHAMPSSSQRNLFTENQEIKLREEPATSILSLLKTGIFFGDSKQNIASILANHQCPSKTADGAVKLEVSAGKNTYTYDAHTYHTKVPPQGIVEFINHYLPEGGVVLDPFAGSGMTGVAARAVGADVILNELSPAACFISHNFTETISPWTFGAAVNTVLNAAKKLRKELYTTKCRECGKNTEILYTVWSYRVLCLHCQLEFTLWDHCRMYGRTVREHKILNEFPCPSCGKLLKKRTLTRTGAVPVILGYKCCKSSQMEHPLNNDDVERIARIETALFLSEGYFPKTNLPDGVNLNQPKRHGLTSIDRFYTMRNLSAMSHLWKEINRLEDLQLASSVAFVFTSLYQRVTRLSEFRFWGGSGNTARFNVPFIFNEANVFVTFERKAASILDHLETTASYYKGKKAVVCNSATDLGYIPDESIDFIFTDPPFGGNINYSEMNILWESWLGEYTDTTNEAIVNRVQGKNVEDYRVLMEGSLSECYRVLRRGHWMLVVFMNSSKKVWDAIKSAVQQAGFFIERLDIFDKQHGTFKQFVSENTAGCDLVLHCRKPLKPIEVGESKKHITYRESILAFLEKRDKSIPVTAYLHVTRGNETDLRRLYSEWLAFGLPKEHELSAAK